mgnify:CR=1 FL=1
MHFVLASSSRRRHDLMNQLGLEFEIVHPDVDETPLPEEDPAGYVFRISQAKAAAVHREGTVTIAADTTVVLDREIVGKPIDEEHAREILGRISGRTHKVYTGLTVQSDRGVTTALGDSEVTMAEMSEADISAYVATGEPMDKAGAYGLQGIGGQFVRRVEGEPSNVIGLPVHLLRKILGFQGIELLPTQ